MSETHDTPLTTFLRTQLAALAGQSDLSTVGQQCSLEVESDGTLRLVIQHPEEDGISTDVYWDVTQSIHLPTGVSPASLADQLAQHLPELETLVNGMGDQWKDSNRVGTLTEEGQTAKWALRDLPVKVLTEWDAEDYYSDQRHEIAARPTEEEAVNLALDGLDEDGLGELDVGGEIISCYVGRRAAEQYAQQVWHQAQEEAAGATASL